MIQLFEQVVLTRDLQKQGLRRGDVATVVDRVPHPQGGDDGCVLEVFNAVSESIAVTVVAESAIESLRSDEVFAGRTLAATT